MTIDMSALTPVTALLGGALIGLAAVLLVLFNGRIAGISGIVGSLLPPRAPGGAWRVAFVIGLLAAPWAYGLFAPVPAAASPASWPVLAIAGLLVGFGTRLGSGCTSGHGVCGLSRLSVRSLVATLCFMAAGFATVFVARHVL
ncbi:YeeE/YedE family protein [Comamonas odontotermitis]|uniref:YeeE/YedE family protein n=1 Tax=Comamonas odontotermitis TaxID=379895 RepID=UPI003750D472